MPSRTFKISGRVCEYGTRNGVPGLRVEIWDKDLLFHDFLAEAPTHAQGAFTATLETNRFRELFLDREPDLFFKVYRDGKLIKSTEDSVIWNVRSGDSEIVIEVELRADQPGPDDGKQPEKPFIVRGVVKDTDGRPLGRVAVCAYDCDLRHKEKLGCTLTDADGLYEIAYSPEQFRRAEKAAADLRVRAFAPDNATELAASQTLFNAPARAVVDLEVTATLLHTDSEWERHGQALPALLEGVQPHELTDEDLEFLKGETGIDLTHLRFVRLDAQWRREQAKHKLPEGAFYGLLRQGLPTDWALLLQAGPARWREALKGALAHRQVPTTLGAQSEPVVATLTELAVDQSFVASAESTSSAAPPVGALLSGSAVPPDMQRQIVGLLLERKPDDDPQQRWQALAEAGVPEKAVRSTRFALEANALVRGHLPTLRVLQGSVAKDFGEGADLTRLSRAQWNDVAQEVASSSTKALPKGFETAEAYAKALADGVELAFPTPVVAYRLLEEADPVRRDVGRFLAQNPEFDLLRSPVDASLEKANYAEIATPRDQLAVQVRKEVCLARIVPATNRAAHMTALLQHGYDSTIKVVLDGEVNFKRRMVPIAGRAATNEISRNAKQRAGDIVLHGLKLRDYFDFPLAVLPHLAPEPGSRLGTWVDLFGSGNGCYCPPCDSAHGPAAYLVDLLEFLKDKPARLADTTADQRSLADVLKERRPDLWHLKLNCANAETPLPYIDLVNESLERVVVESRRPLDRGERRFGPEWITADTTPQTPDDENAAARLRAEPEPGNSLTEVYAEGGPLQQAHYPWSLPFDLRYLQTGVYLSLLGATPTEFLSLHVDASQDGTTTQNALHRAWLGMNGATWTRLHGVVEDRSAVAESWGLARASDLRSLSAIGGSGGLLARSGLTIDELFALVDSPLFQGWNLLIDRLATAAADPCDVDDARLRRMVVGKGGAVIIRDLDRRTQTEVCGLMHRVLRLRLALGWPLDRLLQVLHALGTGKGQQMLDLAVLARMVSLASRLGVSVEVLAQRLLDLRNATASPAGHEHARTAWLALLKLAAADHDHLVALGLPDSLGAFGSAQARMAALEGALDWLSLLSNSGLDPAELRYLLRHEDLVPAVFSPVEAELKAHLEGIVPAIRGAVPPEATPPDATTPDAGVERRKRQVAAAVERLAEITGVAFVRSVIADEDLLPRHALLSATGPDTHGGVVEDFIALASAADSDQNTAKSPTERVDL